MFKAVNPETSFLMETDSTAKKPSRENRKLRVHYKGMQTTVSQ